MTEKQVLEKLKAYLEGKTQYKAAKEFGISRQYLNDIVRGRRAVSGSILKKFGLQKRRVTTTTISEVKPLTK